MFFIERIIFLFIIITYSTLFLIMVRNEKGIRLNPDMFELDILKDEPYISIIIPARNEEKNIGCTLERLAQMKYSNFNIIVVNDHSDDNTQQIVESKFSLFTPDQLTIVTPPTPPKGWLGKQNACWYGANIVKEKNERINAYKKAKYLLFLDADVLVQSKVLINLLSIVNRENVDFLSINPFITTKTFWNKIMAAPLMLILILSILSPKNTKKTYHKGGIAYGGMIFISLSNYFYCGGHEKVKNKYLDDIWLAREVRKANFSTLYIQNHNLFFSINWYPTINDFYNGMDKHTKGQIQLPFLSITLVIIQILLLLPFMLLTTFVLTLNTIFLFMGFGTYLYGVFLNILTKNCHNARTIYSIFYPIVIIIMFFGLTIRTIPVLFGLRKPVWRKRVLDV